MGVVYAEGVGDEPVDFEKSVYWFGKALKAGDTRAAWKIGNLYMHTAETPEDQLLALAWWRKAGELGVLRAQRDLAHAYLRGDGAEQDYVEALYWLKKLHTEFCDPEAQERLGDLYIEGLGAPKNDAASAHLYLKAAEGARPTAMLKLAGMYGEGKGVPQDHSEAYFWLIEREEWMCSGGMASEECALARKLSNQTATHLTKKEMDQAKQRAEEHKSIWTSPPSCHPVDVEELDEEIRHNQLPERQSPSSNGRGMSAVGQKLPVLATL